MRNLLILFVFVISMTGCKSNLVNYALEKKGIYDIKITPKFFSAEDKQIALFPMQHIGRQEYYEDVKRNIDSLLNDGYVFFYEGLIDDITDTLDYYKLRKIIHLGLPEPGRHVDLFEALYESKIKFKYDLVNQPSNYDFGLTDENSFQVDMTIGMIINNVEKSKKILLEDCDFQNKYSENYQCKDKLLTKEEQDKYIVDDRDAFLANEIKNSKYPKIAIIYGRAHQAGIEEQLKK